MFPFLVVMSKPDCQVFEKLSSSFIRLKVDPLVLQGAPETLYEDIVLEAPLAVHADLDIPCLENRGESFAGKLASLVGIEDIRCTVLEESFFKCLNAKPCIQRV